MTNQIFHTLILGKRSDAPRISEFSRPSKTPLLIIPDLVPAVRVFKIPVKIQDGLNTNNVTYLTELSKIGICEKWYVPYEFVDYIAEERQIKRKLGVSSSLMSTGSP